MGGRIEDRAGWAWPPRADLRDVESTLRRRRARRRRPRAALAILGLAVALTVPVGIRAAAAATAGTTFVVTSPVDAVDATPADNVCATAAGVCTLRAAIQQANALPGADIITVPGGTYELAIPPLNQNLADNGDLDITDSLVINGAGASSTVVDGGTPPAGAPPQVRGLDRLFEVLVDDGTVTFTGLTLREGYAAEYGGAIMNSSSATVKVVSSSLTGNVAGKTGGAIDNHFGGTLDVESSTLSDNYAAESGSALNNNRGGVLSVTDSVVSSNSAADVGLDESLTGAGAISNNAELDATGTISVSDSEIIGNRAGGGRNGAAISNDGAGTVSVVGTTFANNRALGDGGAIFNVDGEVTVANGTFLENAAKDGGAISSSGLGSLAVTDSTFTKNSASDWGGAVQNGNKGSASIESSTFTENSALNGGGFGNEGSGLVTVENSTFFKNAAIDTEILVGGEGGGMHSNSDGEVVVIGGAFVENRAVSGGGLSNEGGGQVTITGTRFSTNRAEEAGGGILIQSGAVRMVDIDVVGNVADSPLEGGGGISYAGDKVVSVGESAALESSRVRDNVAKGDGGGIDSRGDGPLVVTTTALTGNTAAVGGAIHHVGDAPLEVTRSTLSGNFAENGGGVFSDGDGEATVENTTISGNRAGQFGGGLLVSSRLTIRSSTVVGNSASSGGGINNGGGDLVGDGSVFVRNTIVSANPTGGNCMGTMTSLGGNVDSANSCQFGELSDQPGTDPRLGPLAANGGSTQTHALLAESPAQDEAVCTETDPCPSVDQRGVARPATAVDIGAFESELAPSGGGAPQPCTGQTERPVPADFDSWVSQAAPGSNFSGDSILKVRSQAGGNERALVHFSLPPVPPGCRLVGATLRLYSSSSTDGRTLEVVRIGSDWNESEVTWGNQPAVAGPAAAAESGLDFRQWDVLAQTLAMYSLGSHGFLLRDRSENESGAQSLHSTEKGTEAPELVLVFDDPDAPPTPGSCPTTPQSLSADRDSWVSESSPSNNFGNDSTLKVKSQGGSNSRALVRFPLPALPSGCTSIASARLRMEVAAAKDGRTLEARRAAVTWSEAGVTWANQPATIGPAATTPSIDGPLEWDVTAQVLAQYTSANDGFLIRDAEENGVGDEQTLNSRHKLNDGPPELVLVFDESTPETTLDPGPISPTDTPDATFTFSSDRDDATFECSLDGAAFTACTTPHAVHGLTEGDHRFEVRATRKVRAVDPTPASHEWTIAVPPETTLEGPASPSASATAELTFSADDPDAIFECAVDGAAAAGCTSPVELTDLEDGRHEFSVLATDRLGNVEPIAAVHDWTVAVPPETTIDDGPADLSNSASASFAFSASDNGPTPSALLFACALDSGAFAPCSSPVPYSALAQGEHTFQVRATDAAGNTDATPASRTWTIDSLAPETTIESGPNGPTNDATPTFEFTASEAGASFQCRVDAAPFAACGSPETTGVLLEGAHTFDVTAIDTAGNVDTTPASRTFTVDTSAPETTISSGPPALGKSSAATFHFSDGEGASTFECKLDEDPWAGCTSPQSYAALADGAHTFQVLATDAAGNTEPEPASYAWTIDSLAPETTIESGPSGPTNDSTPTFLFSASEAAGFQCRVDAAAFAACTSPQTTAVLAEGAHTFDVTATDSAGNADTTPASRTFTVDTAAPETTIESGPATLSRSAEASFGFSADEAGASFQCALDTGVFAPCTSPSPYSALADGAHIFQVLATDAAGNTEPEPASYTWTIDSTAPETTITLGPNGPTNDATPTFEFTASEAGASFQCRVDAAPFAACGSPQTTGVLLEGAHTFQVRASDAAGNADPTPASRSFTLDTSAPETTITAGPSGTTTSTSANFTFSASEGGSSFECALDAGAFAPCTSPAPYSALAEGEHNFRVRATDAAGNVDATAASRTWAIDSRAPETTILTGPSGTSNDSTPTFTFSADDAGASFECRLGTGAFAACTSPHTTAALSDAAYTFEARARDAAGNVGQAASRAFTVDTTAPETTISSGPNGLTKSASASFTFTSEANATFECKLDGGDFSPCASPQPYGPLSDGEHTFQVRATDAAGNTEATPASQTWTIDTSNPTITLTGPASPTQSTSASFAFSAGEQVTGFRCSLDGAMPPAPCTSPVTLNGLALGEHSFRVEATDAAGNTGSSTHTWTIEAPPDTSNPTITLTGPASPTQSTSASFTFSAGEPVTGFRCSLDGAMPPAPCTSPVTLSGLALGEHSFRVEATDAAGNTGSSTHTWTIVAPGACPSGGTVSLGANADTWILQSSATSNYGGDSVIKVDTKAGANARALVRFTLPAIPSGCQVVSATLRLYAGSHKDGRTLEAVSLAAAWNEGSVTWSNQPAATGPVATAASRSGYVSWSVAQQVAAMYTSASNNGFVIRDASESGAGVEQGFHSREKSPDNPPQLVLTFG